MLWTVYACSLAALYAAASWWALKVKKIDRRHWAGASLLGLWLAGAGGKLLFDATARGASANPADTVASVAWPGPRAPSEAPAAMPPHATGVSKRSDSAASTSKVGSVESLIAPLKARLAKHPKDRQGWALLAQSYAYVGNDDGAKRAMARAVALGVDEKALRARVAAVGRSRAHSNWIAAATGN